MEELVDQGLLANLTMDANEILVVAAKEFAEDLLDDALDLIVE